MTITSQSDRKPWHRLPEETKSAYDAFCHYYMLPASERSIDAAWNTKQGQSDSKKRAASWWFKWSREYSWVARALAHDEHLAEQERLLWEERRKQLRQRDWDQADALRAIADEALPHASRFIRRQTSYIEGEDGQPDREVITLSFDIGELTRVIREASRLQRLATDEPTDNFNLPEHILDAIIERELARLAQSSEGEAVEAFDFAQDAADEDSGATEGD